MNNEALQIIECPRDAMQGIHEFIPTDIKINYLNKLLKVGFHTLDAGSFVSPKAIPQLRDTAEVFDHLELEGTASQLLAIVANQRGVADAVQFKQIDLLGYPLSLSETFQQRNTNRSISTAMEDLAAIQEVCLQKDKTLVVYLSMGFGNPYGDPYDAAYLEEFTEKLAKMDVKIISLADTIGVSNEENIQLAFETLIPKYKDITFGAHLHSAPQDIDKKVKAAYRAGCRRFDGAIKGYGGCPMAEDKLVGNMATESMIRSFEELGAELSIDRESFDEAMQYSSQVFNRV